MRKISAPLVFLLPLMAAAPEYRVAAPGHRYEFPRDHFDHPEYQTEWWYYTGNVWGKQGRRYGFELVFFRQGQRRGPSDNPSAWRVDDLYLAHLALTDVQAGQHISRRRLNRAGPGIAGVRLDERRIWNGNWSAQWDGDSGAQTLTAVAEGIRFRLRLRPGKPAVIQGENGLSRKGAEAGQASYYVSFPWLAVSGELNGAAVSGQAWMDHEWFTNQLAPGQVGWDWFSVQLDNHTELMLFQLRHKDGSIDAFSSGTYIDEAGRASHLSHSDFTLEPEGFWKSAKSGGRYPIRWRIRVPRLQIELECAAVVPDQELISEDEASPTYWEGAVDYKAGVGGRGLGVGAPGPSVSRGRGQDSGRAIWGVGYLEMTGYAGGVRF